jgi:hypothetical protein
MVTTARAEAEEGRARALEIARLIATMAGSEVYEPALKEGPYYPDQLAQQVAAEDTGTPARKPTRTYKRIEKSKA